jgi:hypothetical protein
MKFMCIKSNNFDPPYIYPIFTNSQSLRVSMFKHATQLTMHF